MSVRLLPALFVGGQQQQLLLLPCVPQQQPEQE
jgi:hypothetical protein